MGSVYDVEYTKLSRMLTTHKGDIEWMRTLLVAFQKGISERDVRRIVPAMPMIDFRTQSSILIYNTSVLYQVAVDKKMNTKQYINIISRFDKKINEINNCINISNDLKCQLLTYI